MGRLYFSASVEELERLVRENLHNPMVLGQVREELTYRESDRAKALLRDVMGILRGEVPVPRKPPPPDSEANQLALLDD
jgi:hypothetical protein